MRALLAGRRRAQIDLFGSLSVGGPTALDTASEMLPDHPWVGRLGEAVARASVGHRWTVATDLVVERCGDGRLGVRGPLSTIRYRGDPMSAVEIASMEGMEGRPLVLIPAHTVVLVTDASLWDDSEYAHLSGFSIDFSVPLGRWRTGTFGVGTWAEEESGTWHVSRLSWGTIAALAVIVPQDHPLATDQAAAEALVARIERMV